MKDIITSGYVFNHIAKTIDFTNVPFFEKERLTAIINNSIPAPNVIYSSGGGSINGGTFTGDVLQLNITTAAGVSSGDFLQIFYEKGQIGVDETNNVIKTKAQGQKIFRTTFAKTLAVGNVDADYFNIISNSTTSTGQTVAQANSNLIINTGTTPNSELIVRSNVSFLGSFALKAKVTTSQRIINNNFFVELVDIIGDNLTITVNSATSVTVTIPNNPFTSVNVGQSMYIGNLTGFTGVTYIPNRYAIASVSGNDVTFTVASWVTGSVNTGTCSLFGWNYHQILYTGATVTNASFDSQRRGWNSGGSNVTVNTTITGHLAIITSNDGCTTFSDQLTASSTTLVATPRASRVENIADDTVPLFIQIRSLNGSTAPVSNTLLTIGLVSLEEYTPQPVQINDVRSFFSSSPFTIIGGNANSLLDVNIQRLGGQSFVAHSSAAGSQAPTLVAGRASSVADTTLANLDVSFLLLSLAQQLITKPFAVGELDWQYAAAANGIVSSTADVSVRTATASNRHSVSSISLSWDSLATATEFHIKDGSTIIWRFKIPSGAAGNYSETFITPKRGSVNTALNIALSVSTTGGVFANLSGFTTP